MTGVATLHQQRPGGVGDTFPARGRPVANACCAFAASACLQVTSCVQSQSVSTSLSLAGPGVIFLRAGALQAYLFALMHPCLRILLAMYSEAAACICQLL